MTTPLSHRSTTYAGGAAALLLIAALSACSSPKAAGPLEDASAAIDVTTTSVVMTDVVTAIDAGGVVHARTTAIITARLLAPVRDVRVVPGDRVRKGQPLIVLDGDDLAAAARAARSAIVAAEQMATAAAAERQAADAALGQARASHDRVASLHARKSATAQELDDAVAAWRAAEARVAAAVAREQQAASTVDSMRAAGDQARVTESFTTLRAPFDGVVTEKLVDPGNMASPGQALLRVENTSAFRLEVRIDESRLGDVRVGASVPVVLGATESPVAGTVAEISRAVDADARAFLVKIALPEIPGLRSGEFGKARFSTAPRQALTVPASAIVRRGQLTSVFVVDNGRARLRLVNLNENEVLAGLMETELVVVSPPAGLVDGRRVKVGGQ